MFHLYILVTFIIFPEQHIFNRNLHIPDNVFNIKGQYITPLYDYVHLQKGVRNNFVTKDIAFSNREKGTNRKYASWDAITTIYEIEKYSLHKQSQRVLHKITDKHICISRFNT